MDGRSTKGLERLTSLAADRPVGSEDAPSSRFVLAVLQFPFGAGEYMPVIAENEEPPGVHLVSQALVFSRGDEDEGLGR